MGNSTKLDKSTAKTHVQAIVSTVVWSVFLVAGAFAALQLRGDISLRPQACGFVGSVLAAFVLFALISIVYKANFDNKPADVKVIKK